MNKQDSKLNRLLEKKVPDDLQDTLDWAFSKAFQLIFEQGTEIIEKTFKVDSYAADVKDDSKSLKVFSKKASEAGKTNLLISGASGIGLGIAGVGVPDIAVFTALMLRSVYEICLNYGFTYESREEKQFILLLIRGSVAHDAKLLKINQELNYFIEHGKFFTDFNLDKSIRETAGCLSKELLYMKFLQGVPIVGAVGGAYDVIYMKQVNKYAELKYRRRFYTKKMKDND